jgi:hypothetical protein
MYANKYAKVCKQLKIIRDNTYNLNWSPNSFEVQINANFNTFGSEKNLKLIKLYNLIWYSTNQKPILKKIKFNYIKKKILKKFVLTNRLSFLNKDNFLIYFIHHYLYFFQIYYQKPLKYNILNDRFILYIDNPQFFIKNYNKHQQRVNMKISFICGNNSKINQFIKSIADFFLLKIK